MMSITIRDCASQFASKIREFEFWMRCGDEQSLLREVEWVCNVKYPSYWTARRLTEEDKKFRRPVTDPIHFNYAVHSVRWAFTICMIKYPIRLTNRYNVTNVIMTTQPSNAGFRRLGQTCNRISSWGLKHDIHNWIRNGSSPACPAGRQRHQNLKWTLQKQYCVLAW